ncbi:MAG: glycosyltransferase [Bacteroidetes bacterium]|nr:glycosyltransferase [Bacteroidota bacterium]
MKIAVIGNYLPRQCGIATFTYNFVESLLAANSSTEMKAEIVVVAMNDPGKEYDYPDRVIYSIQQDEPEDYIAAAKMLNISGVDICVLQHEYGIYGGESGVLILQLIHQLDSPLVVIVHTVLQHPTFHERAILKDIGKQADMVVVMNSLAIRYLTTIFDISVEKIATIHHGVPDFSKVPVISTNTKTDAADKKKPTLLCTFGLIGRSKGIETVINALPAVVTNHPNIRYMVLGKTHPNIIRGCGEEYRNYLKELVAQYELEKVVEFRDEFLPEEKLRDILREVDIYITPYLNEAQITSGTLSYAVGAGTCVVSTPYWHADEMLADGRGCFFDFGNSDELAKVLNDLLDHPKKMASIREKAFLFGQSMYWQEIGHDYLVLCRKILRSKRSVISVDYDPYFLPNYTLDYVKSLTDRTGILEHAVFHIADLKEGYCLDDNARALLLMLKDYTLNGDDDSLKFADTYLRFIRLMQKSDGSYHNELSYAREFTDVKMSEDAFGRTMWALGFLIQHAITDSAFQFAKDAYFKAFPHFEGLLSNRGIANTIIGICHVQQRYPDHGPMMQMLITLTEKIKQRYIEESDGEWHWFEKVLSYDNAILPLALWKSYEITRSKDTLRIAGEATRFLEQHAFVNDRLSLNGNNPWFYKGEERSSYGQQPIDAMAMVMMFSHAYKMTNDEHYFLRMQTAFTWFMGNNDLFIPLIDEETGACNDGLEKFGVNRNQGAESNISYNLACLTVLETYRFRGAF